MSQPGRIVVVAYPLGRMGSSAMMGLLQRARMNVGDPDRLSGPAPMNPRGFFEFPSQETFLQRVYAGIYPHIAIPPPMDLLREVGRQYAPKYRELLNAELGSRLPAAVKSQWFLTIPFLHELAGEFEVRVLVMERNLHDQVSSLLRVYRETDRPVLRNAGRAFVTAYVEAWRRFGKQVQDAFPFAYLPVSFDRLMSDPSAVMQEVCRFLGIPCPGDSVIREWLDPSLVNRAGLHASPGAESGGGPPPPRPSRAPRLSVVINTLNEEANLEECLESVKGMADEIVVVDMHSDDRTAEIARRYTDRVFLHDRTGVVEPARQFAIDQTRGDWIFILDADERATPELARGIRAVIESPGDIDIFRVPRRNFIAGRWMEGTGLGMDVELQPRLFRRGSLTWPERIHAQPVMKGTEGLLPLPREARIDHLAYDSLFDFVDRLNRYTDHECVALEREGRSWSLGEMLKAAVLEAAARYDPGADGVHSLVLTLSMAYYRFLSWAKLWEKQGCPQDPLPADLGELARFILDTDNRDLRWVELRDGGAAPAGGVPGVRSSRARRSPGVRLGLVIADSTPHAMRYSSDSPLAFGYFISYLREHMPACEVVFRHSVDELLAEGVDLIGISASTERFELAKRMAARARSAGRIPVVVGGVHITVLPENLTGDMDVAVLGEGEVTLTELLECFSRRGGRFVPEDLRKIPGIAFRENGTLRQTTPRDPIPNLDALPIPDRSALAIGLPADRAFLFTSRGCPYRCRFCASSRFWQNLRYFSPEYVVREIEHVLRDLGIRNVHFFDDLFIAPRRRFRDLCRRIVEGGLDREVNFTGAVHAQLVDGELCEMLNRMNVTEVMFGAESFSPRVLDYLKCGQASPADNQRAIDLLHEHGIRVNLSMIYGAPVETHEDLEMTLRALEENLRTGKVQRWQHCRLRLYPGTPVWDEALKRGIVSEGMNWDEIEHPPPHHSMSLVPEQEFRALLDAHMERCIAMRPDNAQMWQEWGLTRRQVAAILARERPDRMAASLDFNRDHAEVQLGDGWYSLEGNDGNRFRWMGRESVTFLRSTPDGTHLHLRGGALPERIAGGLQSLRVSVNHEPLGELPIGESSFDFSLEIPEHLRSAGLLEVQLNALHTFRAPPDVRDLGVTVSRIEVAAPSNAKDYHGEHGGRDCWMRPKGRAHPEDPSVQTPSGAVPAGYA